MHKSRSGRTRLIGAALVALGAVVVVPTNVTPVAAAPTLHVAVGGRGTTCTAAAPCGSIEQAVLLAGPGQEIVVGGGTYDDQDLRDPNAGPVRPSGARAVIRPASGATVRLTGRTNIAAARVELRDVSVTGVIAVVEPSVDVVLDGLQIRQGMVQLRGGSGIVLRRSVAADNVDADFVQIGGGDGSNALTNVVVEDNRLTNATDSVPSDALHVDCLQIFGPVRGLRIQRNDMSGCGNATMMIKSNQGVIADTVIERNMLQECYPRTEDCYSHYAIQVNEGSGGQVTNMSIRHNTIDGGIIVQASPELSVTANIISDPTGRDPVNAACSVNVTGNLIQLERDCASRRSSNTIGAPTYVNRAAGDLALAASSLGLEALSSAPFPDQRGTRGACGRAELGAVERCNGATPNPIVTTVPPAPTTVPAGGGGAVPTPTPTAGVVAVPGASGVPGGVAAVLANLTLADGVAPGYATADRCDRFGATPPTVSSANHPTGEAVSNLAIVPASSSGEFCVYRQRAVQLVADVEAYLVAGAGSTIQPMVASRILDTRVSGPVAPGSITRVATGLSGAPAALVNIALVDAASAGYITAGRCDQLVSGPQSRSNGNAVVGRAVSNLALVPLASDGSFCIYSQNSLQFVVDLQAAVTNSGSALRWTPTQRRVLDTRDQGVANPMEVIRVSSGLPAGTPAAVVNLTMVDAPVAGYVAAGPCASMPSSGHATSNANHSTGPASSNLALVQLDPDGGFCVFRQAPVHLVVDVQAGLSSSGSLAVVLTTPTRRIDTRAA
jgi:hypothetical protein